MGGFSADWLALREPYDRAARNGVVLDAVAAAFADASTVTVTDLGCGTGATMRAVAPCLPARQSWRLVDNDQDLLKKALQGSADGVSAGARVTAVAADLAGAMAPVLGDCHLVTTSALLDLVSTSWLDQLVELLGRLSCPFYAALSYDGTVALSPQSRFDAEVIAAVNRHQRTDKGFGPALGPDAVRTAPERLRAAGFTVIEGRSDWQFGSGDSAVQKVMIAGWAAAAREIGVEPLVLMAWLIEREAYLKQSRSQMRVGHIDFFATPSGRR
jgi:hypothetical protein